MLSLNQAILVILLLSSIGFADNNTYIETISPSSFTRLCPSHVGGDCEFAGHGPEVTAWARLEIRNGREVWLKSYLNAKETKKDWTESEGTWENFLWECQNGYTINRIITDMSSEVNYIDSDHNLDKPAVRGGGLVKKFEIMGDTGGNDSCNCTQDDVYMNIYLNSIKVETIKD